MKKPIILIVDDEPINLMVLHKLLSPYYQVRACKSGLDALRVAHLEPGPELFLLDIMMPDMDGYELLARIREEAKFQGIPAIFLSALDSQTDEEKGFRLGAVDYVTKPFRPAIILERIRVHLELKQARDRLKVQNEWLEEEVSRRMRENQLIQDTALAVIIELAETRDTSTGQHITRTQAYIELLARHLQGRAEYAAELDEKTLLHIVKAAPLHDIGKIGIADAILQKPEPLSDPERGLMQQHCEIGGSAIRHAMDKAMALNHDAEASEPDKASSLRFLSAAELIARNHHEKWDGSGYPLGLRGEAIPLPARMMALADVFDALTSRRCYKEPWDIEAAIAHIRQQSGQHFDPAVVAAFEAELPSFIKICRQLADHG